MKICVFLRGMTTPSTTKQFLRVDLFAPSSAIGSVLSRKTINTHPHVAHDGHLFLVLPNTVGDRDEFAEALAEATSTLPAGNHVSVFTSECDGGEL